MWAGNLEPTHEPILHLLSLAYCLGWCQLTLSSVHLHMALFRIQVVQSIVAGSSITVGGSCAALPESGISGCLVNSISSRGSSKLTQSQVLVRAFKR